MYTLEVRSKDYLQLTTFGYGTTDQNGISPWYLQQSRSVLAEKRTLISNNNNNSNDDDDDDDDNNNK